jgi:hypothetical protein
MGDNFLVPLAREFSPRLDSGTPVPGFLYVVKKKVCPNFVTLFGYYLFKTVNFLFES